ncbi:MAG TPA: hypothetical protein VFI06_08090 [Chitinophagaceae bacterium]|nr:hypothetical protein [Chitinophagaceae bacterium]
MKKISLWARHHRFIAIISIAIIKLLLAFIAAYLGLLLLGMNIRLPFTVFFFALLLLIIAAIAYPSKHITRFTKKQFYVRQKTCDFIIAACSFVMIGTWVNTNLPVTINTAAAATTATTITPTAEEILASLQYRDKSTLTRQEKRILKAEFKNQLKVYTVAKLKGQKNDAAKAGLIILTIVAALGLLYLVAALACSLSCNGSDAAAVIVGLLGLALVIWGTIAVIKRITRKPKKEQEPVANPGN